MLGLGEAASQGLSAGTTQRRVCGTEGRARTTGRVVGAQLPLGTDDRPGEPLEGVDAGGGGAGLATRPYLLVVETERLGHLSPDDDIGVAARTTGEGDRPVTGGDERAEDEPAVAAAGDAHALTPEVAGLGGRADERLGDLARVAAADGRRRRLDALVDPALPGVPAHLDGGAGGHGADADVGGAVGDEVASVGQPDEGDLVQLGRRPAAGPHVHE